MSKRSEYIKSCEISELVKVSLGGVEQKILIEGKSKNLPVVITLHGGPGLPAPFSVGCRGLFPFFTDRAIAVYWDQLGCGANNYRLGDSFRIESFIEMTCELAQYVKRRFPENRVYLFGISWGSILALEAALRIPEKIDGALVYGQVLRNLYFNDEVVRAFDAAPKKVRDSVCEILATGKDCEHELLQRNLKTLYKLMNKFTDAYNNKNSKGIAMGKIILGLLTSPDYSFKDFKAVMKNGYAGNKTLWKELLNVDLTAKLKEIKIKYMILQGDTDSVTSTASVLKAAESLGNENLTVRVMKNSGHIPSAKAMDECFEIFYEFTKK